jgi:hypothetical protein
VLHPRPHHRPHIIYIFIVTLIFIFIIIVTILILFLSLVDVFVVNTSPALPRVDESKATIKSEE